MTSVTLASASPRRYELLLSLGLAVRVVPSDFDEGERPGYAPRELAAHHAGEKADVVAGREPDALVVAADTVVDRDGIALGKPRDRTEAHEMLASLSGRDHVVHTAYVVIDAQRSRIARTHSTTVRFAALTVSDIAAYIATGEPMDKAGAYGIQARGAALVERIDGDYHTVMGFPLGDFLRQLPALGYTLETPR